MLPEPVLDQESETSNITLASVCCHVHGCYSRILLFANGKASEISVGTRDKRPEEVGIGEATRTTERSQHQDVASQGRSVESEQPRHQLMPPHHRIHERSPAVRILGIYCGTVLNQELRHLGRACVQTVSTFSCRWKAVLGFDD